MRRIRRPLTWLGALAVLAALATGVLWWSPWSPRQEDWTWLEATTLEGYLGRSRLRVLEDPDSVEVYRVDGDIGNPGPADEEGTIQGWPILRHRGPATSAEVSGFQGLLREKWSKAPRVQYFLCGFSPGIALRFRRGWTTVDAMICYSCKEWSFFTPAEGGFGRKEGFGVIEPEVIAFGKRLFPNDPVIQELEPGREH